MFNAHDLRSLIEAVANGHLHQSQSIVLACGPEIITAPSDHQMAWFAADTSPTSPVTNCYSALHFAVLTKSFSLLRWFLQQGIDINVVSKTGLTALMLAANIDDASSARELLEAGADHTPQQQQGLTALDIARTGQKSEVIEVIEEHVKFRAQIGSQTKPAVRTPAQPVQADTEGLEVRADQNETRVDNLLALAEQPESAREPAAEANAVEIEARPAVEASQRPSAEDGAEPPRAQEPATPAIPVMNLSLHDVDFDLSE
eukprot:m.85320 g.85320  ORF g.85320 m.85320 type:complete len:259 (+) comp50871_c0_seq3:10-786(+)